MKNKFAIIGSLTIVVVIVAVVAVYFVQKNKVSVNSVENTTPLSQSGVDNQINTELSQNKLVTDDFEISLPSGWQEITPAIGSSAMVVKTNEQLNDPAAQKINFRSYFAVSYDTVHGKSLNEYIQIVKSQLQQTISDIAFAQEHDTTINGKAARSFEADFNQRGVNFKILMVAIKGIGDDVWVISFNTLQGTWTEYRDTFSEIASSFSLKLKN